MKIPPRSGFRELTVEEIELVAGGDGNEEIVVTGSGGGGGGGGGGWGGGGGGWGGGGIGTGGGGGGGGANGDEDGDGVPDALEEIVVTSELTHSEIQALSEAASWMQWQINLGLSAFIGQRLLVSGLTEGAQYVVGLAIGGAMSMPPANDAQYEMIWGYLYYVAVSDKYGYTPENIYYP